MTEWLRAFYELRSRTLLILLYRYLTAFLLSKSIEGVLEWKISLLFTNKSFTSTFYPNCKGCTDECLMWVIALSL